MKKILLGTAAFTAMAAFASAALAADLPSRRAPPVYVPPPVAPAFTWSGFYAGANVGGGFNDYTSYGIAGVNAGGVNAIAVGARPGYLLADNSGIVAGGQIGYNFQLNQGLIGNALNGFGSTLSPITGLFGLGTSSGPVAGIEADADFTGFHNIIGYTGTTGVQSLTSSHQQFLATVRGRIGYGFGNLLVYGTGGFAYGGVNDNTTLLNAAGNITGIGGVNRIQTGYTYGGGVEFAIPTSSFINVFKSSAVTVKVEYLHYVLGDNVGTLASANTGNVYTVRTLNFGNVARAGINYKFDFNQPAPVVARY